jgi:uncharacterized membrane protein
MFPRGSPSYRRPYEVQAIEDRKVRSRAVIAPVLALALGSAICLLFVELRTARTHDPSYRFLDWNLFLAWIPLVLAFGVRAASRRRHVAAAATLAVMWLLFFPNAPYLTTDFIHLREPSAAPVWFDILMLTAFASIGLLLGFQSLHLMHGVLRQATGPRIAWIGVIGTLVLTSFGIYLGRFVQLNSWDAVIHPLRIVRIVLDDNLGPPHPEGFLVFVTCGLAIGYICFFFSATRLRVLATRDRAAPPRWARAIAAGRSELSDGD